jgi:DNA-binding NtrC family response regulator
VSRILVVEDEPVIRGEIARVLTKHGHDVAAVGDVPSARAANLASFDLILTDLRLPGPSGETLLAESGEVPVILVTAYGSIPSAVAAMQAGAADYLTKPFAPDELALVVRRALDARVAERAQRAMQDDLQRVWDTDGIVGDSPPMQAVLTMITKVAPTQATTLVLGESGTGKELVARAIHARSKRAGGPFVAVNCASIPSDLVESELFGHVRGAFTGADADKAGLFRAAQGGTIFLDEIGEMEPAAQARLLRALQDKSVRPVGASVPVPVDARVVAATNRDLATLVQQGAFRKDLYHRLRVLEIRLPPLRDRQGDRLLLARHLVAKLCARDGRATVDFDDDAVAAIAAYDWPGNVRELENAVERALILHESGDIDPSLLGLEAPAEAQPATSLMAYFRRFVESHQHELSETELAKRLGISRKTLWERRKRLNIPRPR